MKESSADLLNNGGEGVFFVHSSPPFSRRPHLKAQCIPLFGRVLLRGITIALTGLSILVEVVSTHFSCPSSRAAEYDDSALECCPWPRVRWHQDHATPSSSW